MESTRAVGNDGKAITQEHQISGNSAFAGIPGRSAGPTIAGGAGAGLVLKLKPPGLNSPQEATIQQHQQHPQLQQSSRVFNNQFQPPSGVPVAPPPAAPLQLTPSIAKAPTSAPKPVPQRQSEPVQWLQLPPPNTTPPLVTHPAFYAGDIIWLCDPTVGQVYWPVRVGSPEELPGANQWPCVSHDDPRCSRCLLVRRFSDGKWCKLPPTTAPLPFILPPPTNSHRPSMPQPPERDDARIFRNFPHLKKLRDSAVKSARRFCQFRVAKLNLGTNELPFDPLQPWRAPGVDDNGFPWPSSTPTAGNPGEGGNMSLSATTSAAGSPTHSSGAGTPASSPKLNTAIQGGGWSASSTGLKQTTGGVGGGGLALANGTHGVKSLRPSLLDLPQRLGSNSIAPSNTHRPASFSPLTKPALHNGALDTLPPGGLTPPTVFDGSANLGPAPNQLPRSGADPNMPFQYPSHVGSNPYALGMPSTEVLASGVTMPVAKRGRGRPRGSRGRGAMRADSVQPTSGVSGAVNPPPPPGTRRRGRPPGSGRGRRKRESEESEASEGDITPSSSGSLSAVESDNEYTPRPPETIPGISDSTGGETYTEREGGPRKFEVVEVAGVWGEDEGVTRPPFNIRQMDHISHLIRRTLLHDSMVTA
ncbi:hypothetical protein M427DRAFT_171683 [Gonapodya prolifera JEL478]|uniref:PWWP domain-containing protein n=1 Tax=Gonapodya prolifera (strain JEL478) TaxID=1344416 RepID=A0A139B118_GONPJ|nr:hypothetical protein M427DRAFT_171683 [Gonapodya prolifera JEL478]|eukprot:KXS22395.1 hypothetical protein M427DRAFT_171683 [Gonapodya prolifera JEL478]